MGAKEQLLEIAGEIAELNGFEAGHGDAQMWAWLRIGMNQAAAVLSGVCEPRFELHRMSLGWVLANFKRQDDRPASLWLDNANDRSQSGAELKSIPLDDKAARAVVLGRYLVLYHLCMMREEAKHKLELLTHAMVNQAYDNAWDTYNTLQYLLQVRSMELVAEYFYAFQLLHEASSSTARVITSHPLCEWAPIVPVLERNHCRDFWCRGHVLTDGRTAVCTGCGKELMSPDEVAVFAKEPAMKLYEELAAAIAAVRHTRAAVAWS